jgi:hypothetical protein
MYPALLAGGNIELLPEDAGGQSLMEALRRGGRNVVKITPAHLELLAQEIRPGEAFAMTKHSSSAEKTCRRKACGCGASSLRKRA